MRRSYRGRYVRAMASGHLHYWQAEAASSPPPATSAPPRGVIPLGGASVLATESDDAPGDLPTPSVVEPRIPRKSLAAHPLSAYSSPACLQVATPSSFALDDSSRCRSVMTQTASSYELLLQKSAICGDDTCPKPWLPLSLAIFFVYLTLSPTPISPMSHCHHPHFTE